MMDFTFGVIFWILVLASLCHGMDPNIDVDLDFDINPKKVGLTATKVVNRINLETKFRFDLNGLEWERISKRSSNKNCTDLDTLERASKEIQKLYVRYDYILEHIDEMFANHFKLCVRYLEVNLNDALVKMKSSERDRLFTILHGHIVKRYSSLPSWQRLIPKHQIILSIAEYVAQSLGPHSYRERAFAQNVTEMIFPVQVKFCNLVLHWQRYFERLKMISLELTKKFLTLQTLDWVSNAGDWGPNLTYGGLCRLKIDDPGTIDQIRIALESRFQIRSSMLSNEITTGWLSPRQREPLGPVHLSMFKFVRDAEWIRLRDFHLTSVNDCQVNQIKNLKRFIDSYSHELNLFEYLHIHLPIHLNSCQRFVTTIALGRIEILRHHKWSQLDLLLESFARPPNDSSERDFILWRPNDTQIIDGLRSYLFKTDLSKSGSKVEIQMNLDKSLGANCSHLNTHLKEFFDIINEIALVAEPQVLQPELKLWNLRYRVCHEVLNLNSRNLYLVDHTCYLQRGLEMNPPRFSRRQRKRKFSQV